MIEKTVINYLNENLSVPVAMEREGQNAPFVLIERTGSARTNRINTTTLAFQSYGRTLLESAELNENVKAVADNLTQFGEIIGVHFVRDYNFTDTSTKDYRYQAIFDVTSNMEV